MALRLAPSTCAVRRSAPRQAAACSATPSRRELLSSAAGAALLVALPAQAQEFNVIPAAKLARPYREAERAAFGELLLAKIGDASETLDYRKCLRLLFNDAAAGGRNGSVHYPEEMARPENAGLADTLKALAAVKAAVDSESKTDTPLSWTDLLSWAAYFTTRRAFRLALAAQFPTGVPPPGAGNDFGRPPLCGADAAAAAPAGSIPGAAATSAEWKTLFLSMGLSLGDLAVLGPEVIGGENVEALLASDPELETYMRRLAASKAQVGRTSYEVSFSRAFLKLAQVGFKTDPTAYLYDYSAPVLRL